MTSRDIMVLPYPCLTTTTEHRTISADNPREPTTRLSYDSRHRTCHPPAHHGSVGDNSGTTRTHSDIVSPPVTLAVSFVLTEWALQTSFSQMSTSGESQERNQLESIGSWCPVGVPEDVVHAS